MDGLHNMPSSSKPKNKDKHGLYQLKCVLDYILATAKNLKPSTTETTLSFAHCWVYNI